VDFDHAPLLGVEVVDVAAGLLHQHALDQLVARPPIGLAYFRRRADSVQHDREFLNEKVLGVAVLTPPGVLPFKLLLRFFKQYELHVGLGTV
jgi:hypothetical protein